MNESRGFVIVLVFLALIVGALPVEAASGEGKAAAVVRDFRLAPRHRVAFDGRHHPVPGPYGYGDPYYGRYYYREHETGKSPYEDLQVRPAGALLLSVVPAHAQVWVDGYEVKPGSDNSYDLGLLVGPHQVQVQAEGYRPYSEEIMIEAAKRTVLSIELKR